MNNLESKNFIEVIMFCCMYNNCYKHYNTKFNLKQHIENVHLKIKKYQCKYCKKMLISKQNLKEHLNIHTESMPFRCNGCEKSFRQASQLSLHRRSHSEEELVEPEKLSKIRKSESLFTKSDLEKLETKHTMVPLRFDVPLIDSTLTKAVILPNFSSINRKSNPYILRKVRSSKI